MADPRNPLLNPVLRFTKDPKPEGITGGGKNAFGIKADRLDRQRRALGLQLRTLAAQSAARPKFNGRVVLYAAMFDDSLAPTWTPNDLFQATRDARLIAPYRTGYLVEARADQLTDLVLTWPRSRSIFPASNPSASLVRTIRPAAATWPRSGTLPQKPAPAGHLSSGLCRCGAATRRKA